MKGRFGCFLNKIKSFLFHRQKVKQVLMACGFLFLSFLFLIPAGALHDSTPIYESAQYMSQIIKNNSDINYIGIIAEQIDEEHKMNSTVSEYRGLYGTFGNRKVNYAGTVNADKEAEIYLSDFENCPNLSFLYVTAGYQSKTYEDHFMHETYPIELMFNGYTNRMGDDYSFVYLSQSQADALIMKNSGISKDEITTADYEALIKQSTTIKIQGVDYSFTIGNVYLETNYFYDALHECMGDFLMGYNFFPEGLQKQAMFFMNTYEFQNKTHLQYSVEQYSPNRYKYKIAKENIAISFNEGKALSFARVNTVKTVFSYILLTISIIGFLASCFFIYKTKLLDQKANYIYFIASPLIVYLFFYAIFKLSKFIYVFSPFAVQAILYMMIALVALGIVSFFINLWQRSDA